MFVDEVRDEECRTSFLEGISHIAKSHTDVGAWVFRCEVDKFTYDQQDVFLTLLGWDELLDFVGKEDYADLIIVGDGRVGYCRSNLGNHLTLVLSDSSEETAS